MKKGYLLVILLLILLLTGCNQESKTPNGNKKNEKGEPGLTGYVMNSENGRILVVDTVAQDFSSTGGISEFYNAIWFAGAPDDIKIGDKVEVWFDTVAESYPGQSEVEHIKVINNPKPSRADLSESEVLNKVLTSDDKTKILMTVVLSINYDEDLDQWNIILKDIFGENGKQYEFQIEDK